VLEAVEADLRDKLAEMGAEACLQSLEDSLSNVLRVGERQAVAVDAFSRVIERLYGEHVEPVAIARFSTHLPLYSLRAAAGRLARNGIGGRRLGARAADVRLTPDLFVATWWPVDGAAYSDGSLNLFRLNPVGSRRTRFC